MCAAGGYQRSNAAIFSDWALAHTYVELLFVTQILKYAGIILVSFLVGGYLSHSVGLHLILFHLHKCSTAHLRDKV